MKTPYPFFPFIKVRVIYVISVVLVALFVCAILWFGFYLVISPIQTSVMATAHSFPNSTLTPTLDLADTFMVNLWQYLLAIVVLGIAYWVYIYSQRKGQVMYP